MISAPAKSYDDEFFWEGAKQRELRIQRCGGCGLLRHPPAPMCGHCHSTERTTIVSAGRGTLYSWVVSKHPTQPDAAPRTVILVDLDEGVRLVSNLIDHDGVELRPGLPVEVTFVDQETFTLPQFRPVVSS